MYGAQKPFLSLSNTLDISTSAVSSSIHFGHFNSSEMGTLTKIAPFEIVDVAYIPSFLYSKLGCTYPPCLMNHSWRPDTVGSSSSVSSSRYKIVITMKEKI